MIYIKKKFVISALFVLLSCFFLLTTESNAGAIPQSDCCFENGTAGCDNQACENAVCEIDEFCCEEEWDDICVSEAELLCTVCGGGLFQFSLTPRTAVNPIFTEHTVTATLLSNGQPNVGIEVFFEVISGPNDGKEDGDDGTFCSPNDDCTTDANGQVSWTYSSELPGTDTIIAQLELLSSNTVEKEWILVRNIPTLSEWGMISAAAVLGLIGIFYLIARKRRALS